MTREEREYLRSIANQLSYIGVEDLTDRDSKRMREQTIDALNKPERKKGKWIFYETENERYDDIKCPFCKKTYTVDAYRIDDIGFTAEDFKFCPNCGNDMRGD